MDDFFTQFGVVDGSQDINKSDILRLLEIGLKENQPFAKHFADTILRELQRKLKGLQIQSSAIEIDGKSIGEDISKQIKTDLEKDVAAASKAVGDKLKKASESSDKVSSEPVNIASLLGQTPKMSKVASVKFNKITSELLDRLSRGMPDKIDFSTGVSIGSLFQPVGAAGRMWNDVNIRHAIRWGRIQKNLLGKIEEALPLPGAIQLDKLNISSLLMPPAGGPAGTTLNLLGIRTAFKWHGVQNELLQNLTSAINGASFAFDGELTLDDLFGSDKGFSLITKMKWHKLQNYMLGKAKGDADKASEREKTPKKIKQTKVQKDADSNTLKAEDKKQDPVPKTVPILKAVESIVSKKKFESLEEKEPTVKVSGFTKQALKDLSGITGASKVAKVADKDEKSSWGLLGKVLLPVLLAVAAGIALFKGFEDEGPFKGAKVLIGKIGIMGALKWLKSGLLDIATKFTSFFKTLPKFLAKPFEEFVEGAIKVGSGVIGKLTGSLGKISFAPFIKSIGSKLAKGIKFIPFIGSAIDFYDAYTRFQQGKWGTGLSSLASGVIGLIPGAGTALKIGIGLGIGVFNAITDYVSGGKEKETIETKAFSFKDLMGRIKDKMFNFFQKTPFYMIGTGIQKIFAGDFKKGFKEFGTGLVMSNPLLAPMAMMLNYLNETPSSETNPETGQKMSIFDAFKKHLYDKIRSGIKLLPDWLKTVISYIPGAKALVGDIGVIPDTPIPQGPSDEEIKYAEQHQSTGKSSTGARGRRGGKPKTTVEVDPIPTNDFIWRKDQKIQKFAPTDNIIGVKNDKQFGELVKLLKDAKKPVDANNNQLQNDITKLIMALNRTIVALNEAASNMSKPSNHPTSVSADLPGIPLDAGDVRDPAYTLRTRAWDRIRKGYVVL
jgi:hypothetical protein